MKLILFFSLCLILSACQTNLSRQFEKIKPGADKDTVLDMLGSPRNITRMGGEDRWYYMYYQDEIRQQKEVHFSNGLVTYSGERQKPAVEVDPVAVDQKNIEMNKKYEDELEARKAASKNAFNNYQKYEKKVKKEDEIQYLPEFESVE